MDLTIVLATLNEAENIKQLIPKLLRYFADKGIRSEVLVIDGNSPDGTAQIARSLDCRVLIQSKPGYATAIREGLGAATGRYVMLMDADCSHPAEDALRLWENRKKADIIVASRYIPGGGTATSRRRDLLSRVLNALFKRVLGLPFNDLSGSFRIYNRRVLKGLELKSESIDIHEEILVKLYWAGFRVVELPFVYLERNKGVSKTQIFKCGIRILQTLYKLWSYKRNPMPSFSGREIEERLSA